MLLLLSTALAGDPCPIPVRFMEVTPSWRERTADLAALKRQRTMYGVTYRGQPVRVTQTMPHTHADAVLRKGDVLETIQGTPVTSSNQVGDLLGAATGPVTVGLTRDGAPMSVVLNPTPVDPFVLTLFDELGGAECRERGFTAPDEAQRKAIHQAVFDENRGFRCADAHTALPEDLDQGTLVVVRGGTRVLLSMRGWATRCVGVDETEAATGAFHTELLQDLTKAYVADRHANP